MQAAVLMCKLLCGGVGAHEILVSAPVPFGFKVLDLIGTRLELGLGGFGTKGLGTGLDNKSS